jgi:hypothetical protein
VSNLSCCRPRQCVSALVIGSSARTPLFTTIMEAIRILLSEVKLEAVAHRNTEMLKTVAESATVEQAIKVRSIIHPVRWHAPKQRTFLFSNKTAESNHMHRVWCRRNVSEGCGLLVGICAAQLALATGMAVAAAVLGLAILLQCRKYKGIQQFASNCPDN